MICLSIEHGLSKIAKQKVNKIKKNELNLKKEFIDNIDIHNNDDILPLNLKMNKHYEREKRFA